MNKTELIAAVAEKASISKKESEVVITKESITIAASKVPTFKAGKAFKDAVAE